MPPSAPTAPSVPEPFILPVFRLTYVSRIAPEHGDGAAIIPDILARAQTNNAANDLTGLLIVHDGCFIQALEGPEDRVQAAFAKICRDKRHQKVLIVEQCGARWRLFPLWTMSARLLSDADAAMLDQLDRRRFDAYRATPDELLALLLAVAEVHERIIVGDSSAA